MEDNTKNVSFWIIRTICVAIILFTLVYAVQQYIGIPILTDAMVAVTLVLLIGLAHEFFHYIVAVRLGYKPVWFREKMKMGFDITPHTNRKKWRKDNKKIALTPYYVLIPVSLLLIGGGYYYGNLGITIAGIGSLLLHGMSIKKEGVLV